MALIHIHFWPTFWGFMAVVTETIGGLFSILGLWFRLVSILMVFVFIMAVMHHIYAGDGLGSDSHLPEALELGFAYFGFIFLGPGRFSIDKG
jgi:putative oxidoreductase